MAHHRVDPGDQTHEADVFEQHGPLEPLTASEPKPTDNGPRFDEAERWAPQARHPLQTTTTRTLLFEAGR